MGGENDIRGFDVRAISPVTYIPTVFNQAVTFRVNNFNGGVPSLGGFTTPVIANTITFPGGDLQGVGNIEYRIPIAGPVSMTLFLDAGTVGILRRDGLRLNQTGVDNINNLFPLSNQQAQLQIAPGTNFKMRASTGIEFNINLPIVQAPFRIYYAYNPLRLDQVVAPVSPITRSMFPTGAAGDFTYANAVSLYNPGYLIREPRKTFRFTVATTF